MLCLKLLDLPFEEVAIEVGWLILTGTFSQLALELILGDHSRYEIFPFNFRQSVPFGFALDHRASLTILLLVFVENLERYELVSPFLAFGLDLGLYQLYCLLV